MDYGKFLDDQINLQQHEVKNMRKIMYAVLGICLLILGWAVISKNEDMKIGDMMKFGFSVVTGGLALVPRAELIKRREKISGLNAIKGQYQVIDGLSGEDKEFINSRLKELMMHTLSKI